MLLSMEAPPSLSNPAYKDSKRELLRLIIPLGIQRSTIIIRLVPLLTYLVVLLLAITVMLPNATLLVTHVKMLRHQLPSMPIVIQNVQAAVKDGTLRIMIKLPQPTTKVTMVMENVSHAP